MPVFSNLLPAPHNNIILNLLFELATWQAFAKLRLHTESTLSALEASTTRLGHALRRFEDETCSTYATKDLPTEEAARGRRKVAQMMRSTRKGLNSEKSTAAAGTSHNPPAPEARSKIRRFNISTYKTHALGDYVETIRRYGTTDGYSTQVVCFTR